MPHARANMELVALSRLHYWRSLAKNEMYRFQTLLGTGCWHGAPTRRPLRVAIRVGVINRVVGRARSRSVRVA